MNDVLFVMLGFAHLVALAGLIVLYCRHIGLPWREWPLVVFVLLWSALVATGYLVSLFDALGSLPAYIVTSFLGLGFVVLAHRVVFAAPQKTPYARISYPAYVDIASPKMRRFLWRFLAGTLAAALVIHLIVCFSFYPVNADSLNYRLARPFWYVSHGNLLHPFMSVDKRLTFYPVDGILLYVPLILYGVSSVFFGLPSLFSWLTLSYATYRFARALQAERLIALFATWLVAMTPSILIEASSTNDEILIAAPLVAGLFFIWRWLTSGAEHYLFLAALGAGLCIGTKLHVFFLIPIALIGFLWFAWFLWRRHESWRIWLPRVRVSVMVSSFGALSFMGLTFLVLNYISSGNFYFLADTAQQVLNLGASLQDAMQNFIIYTSSMIMAPIADLNFWQSFHGREETNRVLNNMLAPLIQPFVSDDPHFYHLKYRFHGIIIPTSVLLVEYGLWPGFMWLLWPLQVAALARQKFTLRPFFVMLAATPVIWLVIWSCVTLYMEGVPTYFAFYLMCAAPASVLCLVRAGTLRFDRIRWAIIAFVVATTAVIDGNVGINNTFRGLWHFTENQPWPYDWLRFQRPIIDEIRRANKIHIALTHGKVYYFAFMHWNPQATYYSPYQAPPNDPGILHILTTPSEASYGFMPIKIPDKPTPGITYLGHIRGVDREEVFAFGNDVNLRHPDDCNFISLHVTAKPAGPLYNLTIDSVVPGLNVADQLEFDFALKTLDKIIVYERTWDTRPDFSIDVPHSPGDPYYLLTISVRSALNYSKTVSETFAIGGSNAWRIAHPGDPPDTDDD